jgi:hypothetical protein
VGEFADNQRIPKRGRRVVVQVAMAVVVCALAAVGIYLAVSRGGDAASADVASPARLEPVGGAAGLSRVVLSAEAAKRLDIKTAPVSTVLVQGKPRKAIPYEAVLYEVDGDAWTYTSPEPRVFVRDEISVARVQDGMAVLTKGPAVGTAVVTVGSAELWGVEYGEISED